MASVSARDLESVPATRKRLIAAAIRLLEDGGPEALQARRLAAEVGASTMAVYTHFGGMRQLVEAVAADGFARFSRLLADVPETADPVADLLRQGVAYRDHAVANPQLYRVMFGVTAPGGHRLAGVDMNELMVSGQFPEGRDAFGLLTRAVERVIAAGDGSGEDPVSAASQIWSAAHGYVLLEIAGYFGPPGRGMTTVFLPLAVKLISGLGHSPEAVWRSARRLTAGLRGADEGADQFAAARGLPVPPVADGFHDHEAAPVFLGRGGPAGTGRIGDRVRDDDQHARLVGQQADADRTVQSGVPCRLHRVGHQFAHD
jgi:AcrR family transcriptional regulator